MPLCVRKSGDPHTMKDSTIQERSHNDDSERMSTRLKCIRPPPSGSRVGGGGHKRFHENEYEYDQDNMLKK
eukprot:6142620-Amphidinium_carterae.1